MPPNCALKSGTYGATEESADVSSPKADKVGQVALDWWKIYLDSCVTYHTTFAESILSNIHDVDIVLKGRCNNRVTASNKTGLVLCQFKMWMNKKGIVNPLLISQLEGGGFSVKCDTHVGCFIYTPEGKKIVLEQGTGLVTRCHLLTAVITRKVLLYCKQSVITLRVSQEGMLRKQF